MKRSWLAIGACGAGALLSWACRGVVGTDEYFEPNGATIVASLASLDEAPRQLTIAGDQLFYLQAASLYAVPKNGSGSVTLVHTFGGPPLGLSFDGNDTLLACDPVTGLYALSARSHADAPLPPGTPLSCLYAGTTADGRLAYFKQVDGGGDGPDLLFVLSSPDGGSTVTKLSGNEDPIDVALGVDGNTIYATASKQMRVAGAGGKLCPIAQTGTTTRPRIVAARRPDGGTQLLARGRGDVVVYDDEAAPCCDGATNCSAASSGSAVALADGDFVVGDTHVYWSTGNGIFRQSLSDFPAADAGVELLDTFPVTAIPSLAVDDAALYFVVGSRLLRLPLPTP